jgi:hypothetical protein
MTGAHMCLGIAIPSLYFLFRGEVVGWPPRISGNMNSITEFSGPIGFIAVLNFVLTCMYVEIKTNKSEHLLFSPAWLSDSQIGKFGNKYAKYSVRIALGIVVITEAVIAIAFRSNN